ncbi:hypothetical protein [Aliiroseovarius sp. F20344]|uniref:hypothetical protein n=1 Tax=Aliiroseovarius sp. F20344 TaxID=2926414 RepID=UPI001FF3BFA5|nr:hypothetical protein [Aliiroseovarius sp. F20344]MCK0140945.1 hypothetical protein [Aliiroseovarius sp. F20344]
MRIRWIILSLPFLSVTPVQAMAGAWPREKGEVFVSAMATQDTDQLQGYPIGTAYVEYGLRHNITVAGKITYDFAVLEATEYELSARWHFPDNDKPLKKAISLTLAGPVEDPRVEPRFHFGYGFDSPFGAGWADLEVYASVSTQGLETDYGGYGVLGLKPHDRLMAMLGVDVMVTPDKTFVKAIPSVAWELNPNRHLTMQYTRGLQGIEESEFGMGLWLQF